VNHVVVAHQEPDPPIYVVFRRPNYEAQGVGPGLPKGPFTLLDSEGYIIPAFHNLLDEDGDIFAYAGANRLATAHLLLHSGDFDNPNNWWAQVLHIVPVTPLQQSVLNVVVGPPIYGNDDFCEAGFYWAWQTRDRDADGVPEIEIGPLQNREGEILPRAVYRWSNESGQYDGPDGSVEEGFVRLHYTHPHEEVAWHLYYEAIEQFALKRQRLPNPGDPAAVRGKSKCETFTLGGIISN
jgi:hypothetical protein